LELIEPETGVTVKLVGAMHYNPTSIALATSTIEALALEEQLGSVIVESCDIRWKSSQNSSIILQKLLQSEMRAACDVAQAYNRPVVLGDQRINITVDKMKLAFQETVGDLVRPPMGWKRIVGNITQAWQEGAAPSSSDDGSSTYLTPVAFLDPRLLLAAPVSFFKYPFSYLVKSPVQTIAVLSLLFLTDMTGSATSPEELGVVDYVASLSFALLEVAVFARIILKEILAERNEILAASILEQCRIYQKQQQTNSGWFGTSFGQSQIQQTTGSSEIVYVPNTNNKNNDIKIVNGNDGKTVVAVLGMAHCNGIKKLLLKE
jgi:pheromone shutdown protein TraB